MADVVLDGTGAPIFNPSFVVFDGVGVPVGTANRPPSLNVNFNNVSPIVSLGAAAAIFPPPGHEEFFDGVGVPVAVGSIPGFVSNFDNRGKNVSYGAAAAIFPDVSSFGAAGVPVGTGNKSFFPVNGFDNQGKTVVEVRAPRGPVGTELWKEVTFVGDVINVGNN